MPLGITPRIAVPDCLLRFLWLNCTKLPHCMGELGGKSSYN